MTEQGKKEKETRKGHNCLTSSAAAAASLYRALTHFLLSEKIIAHPQPQSATEFIRAGVEIRQYSEMPVKPVINSLIDRFID